MQVHNVEPKAFVRTATAESILTKVRGVGSHSTNRQSMTRHTTSPRFHAGAA